VAPRLRFPVSGQGRADTMSGRAQRPGILCQGSGAALPQPCEARKPAQAGRRLLRKDRDCRRGGERARRDHGGKRDAPPEARPPMAAEPPILRKPPA